MEELHSVSLMGIFLTVEGLLGRKRKLKHPSQKLREPFVEKVGLHGMKCESNTFLSKTTPGKIAFI